MSIKLPIIKKLQKMWNKNSIELISIKWNWFYAFRATFFIPQKKNNNKKLKMHQILLLLYTIYYHYPLYLYLLYYYVECEYLFYLHMVKKKIW